jgi:cytochrome b6-f complex iron-sulfur subunit
MYGSHQAAVHAFLKDRSTGENMTENCKDTKSGCSGRREFLVKAIAGGVSLSMIPAAAQAGSTETPAFGETVIKLDPASPLNKVGGSLTVETPSGKVVIARTSESGYAAVSAVCTHKGGPLGYDASAKLFTCPNHGSKFGTDGSNVGGPAKTPVKTFVSQSAVVISGD